MWEKIGNNENKTTFDYVILDRRETDKSDKILSEFNGVLCNIGINLANNVKVPINKKWKMPDFNQKSIEYIIYVDFIIYLTATWDEINMYKHLLS